MNRPRVNMRDFKEAPTENNSVSQSEVPDVDAARERLETHVASREKKAQDDRRATVKEAVEVLDELHRIVEAVANHDDVAESTQRLVREAAEHAVRRTGEVVERTEVSTESEVTPKERLMLSIESFSTTRAKLQAELESLSQDDTENAE